MGVRNYCGAMNKNNISMQDMVGRLHSLELGYSFVLGNFDNPGGGG